MGDREEREGSRCAKFAELGGEYELSRLKQEECIGTLDAHAI